MHLPSLSALLLAAALSATPTLSSPTPATTTTTPVPVPCTKEVNGHWTVEYVAQVFTSGQTANQLNLHYRDIYLPNNGTPAYSICYGGCLPETPPSCSKSCTYPHLRWNFDGLILTLSQRVTLNGTLTNVYGSGPLVLHNKTTEPPYGSASYMEGWARICADRFVPA